MPQSYNSWIPNLHGQCLNSLRTTKKPPLLQTTVTSCPNFIYLHIRDRAFAPAAPISWNKSTDQGRIQDFHLGGGGQKIMCAHAHHERLARCPLRPGSRARLGPLEALRVFCALSCYISLIFKHSDTKLDKYKVVLCPPLNPSMTDKLRAETNSSSFIKAWKTFIWVHRESSWLLCATCMSSVVMSSYCISSMGSGSLRRTIKLEGHALVYKQWVPPPPPPTSLSALSIPPSMISNDGFVKVLIHH